MVRSQSLPNAHSEQSVGHVQESQVSVFTIQVFPTLNLEFQGTALKSVCQNSGYRSVYIPLSRHDLHMSGES